MIQNEQLATDIANCTKCRLSTDRNSGLSVPGLPGPLYIRQGLAIFAEAPGADEEKPFKRLASGSFIGSPLIGRSGQLLNQLLKLAGTSRDEVLVLNRIRCRPPRNRIQDYPDAVAQCDEWVKKELEEYDPKVVILTGNTALRTIFGATTNITSTRGSARATSTSHNYGQRIWIPTFHPAFALRQGGIQSEAARSIIQDIKLALELLID